MPGPTPTTAQHIRWAVQTLRLLIDGRTPEQIAAETGRSHVTIKRDIALLRALSVRLAYSRAEKTYRVNDLGIFHPDRLIRLDEDAEFEESLKNS